MYIRNKKSDSLKDEVGNNRKKGAYNGDDIVIAGSYKNAMMDRNSEEKTLNGEGTILLNI